MHTLTLTDIASGWTECVPLPVRGCAQVTEAIEALRPLMPFPRRALDTDNGSEFLNDRLIEYCHERNIEFTHSRPYRKNDQAWVEQKNGAVVRRLVGYRRLEGWPAAEALSRLYSASRLFVNFFQPSFKLAAKIRVGAHIRKRYHPRQTPCQRLLASDAIPAEIKVKLSQSSSQLDPLRLLEDIRRMQSDLVALVDQGEAYTPSPANRDLASAHDIELAQLVTDLTRGKLTADHPCHLDPDLEARTLPRPPGWRGALGQVSAAQSHLANNRIAPGDLFLFWGLFQPVTKNKSRRWQFTGHAEHRLFGWLQIDEIVHVGTDPTAALAAHPWLASHPHLATGWSANNTVYLARDTLALPGLSQSLPGCGLMKTGVRLTKAGSPQPSTWTAPAWLDPLHGGTGLTYHPPER